MSTTQQHTPGPWVVLGDNGYYDIADDSGENYVCGCEGIDNEANARLIAASPTMHDYIKKKAEQGCEEAKSILDALL